MLPKKVMLIFMKLSIIANCIAQNNYNSMQTASLIYKVREAKSSSHNSALLILLHGHGSNEHDLLSLGASIPENWTVVSVRGPHKLAENSYRWYDVKLVNEKITINIEQEEKSRKQLMELIADLITKYKIDDKKIVIAGFSQGANMAQTVGLGQPDLIAGFGVFSGRYVEEFTPFISTDTKLKYLRAYIAHGNLDNMLPKTYTEENINKLKDLGIQITYVEDSTGHSISIKQWNEFLMWLQKFN